MPNTHLLLPIRCPKCQHVGSTLLVRSATAITSTCVKCGHQWATDAMSLPEDVQAAVHALDVSPA